MSADELIDWAVRRLRGTLRAPTLVETPNARGLVRSLPIVALLFVSLGASAAPPDDALRARLEKGEIVVDAEPGGAIAFLTAQGVVDAPPEVVWDVVSHCALYRGRMPRIVESQELERNGDHVRCRVVVETAWPMSNLTSITSGLHTVQPGIWKREWALESGDYVVNEGSWTLTPFDAASTRTLVVYRLHAEAKLSVPVLLQEIAQKRALPETLEAVRRVAGELATR